MKDVKQLLSIWLCIEQSASLASKAFHELKLLDFFCLREFCADTLSHVDCILPQAECFIVVHLLRGLRCEVTGVTSANLDQLIGLLGFRSLVSAAHKHQALIPAGALRLNEAFTLRQSVF